MIPIRVKTGVRLHGMNPMMTMAIMTAVPIWETLGARDFVITSGLEGRHRRKSQHFKGDALDFRTHNLPAGHRSMAWEMLQDALGEDFTVIHENVGSQNEHIHVHWAPVAPYD